MADHTAPSPARGGFSIIESDSAENILKDLATWSSFLDFQVYPVLDLADRSHRHRHGFELRDRPVDVAHVEAQTGVAVTPQLWRVRRRDELEAEPTDLKARHLVARESGPAGRLSTTSLRTAAAFWRRLRRNSLLFRLSLCCLDLP